LNQKKNKYLKNNFENMKGISTVVATVLMLMITIALIAVAWGFISGVIGGAKVLY
jgi:flagellin-like protein